jgi:transcriptional regulator with XRE-family HTH domain
MDKNTDAKSLHAESVKSRSLLEARKALGKKIFELRQSSGRSQEQFAGACHITLEYLRMIERGECNLTLAVMARTTKELGISLSDLFQDVA